MLTNYIKIVFRTLKRNKAYAGINVIGLALGMACTLLIFMLVTYHLHFDNFHANADRIYRIVTEQHRDVISYTPGVPSPLGKAFREEYDFAETVARIATEENMTITVDDGKEVRLYKEEGGVAVAEPAYFDIFNFPLLTGDVKTALTQPNTGIITEHLAKKYFGNENPINKTIQFGNKIAVRITGVLKDLPQNTDQKTEIFVSYPTLKQYNEFLGGDSWSGISGGMNCYIRLRPQVTVAQVEAVFPAYVTKYRPASTNVHHYKLQPLADIHFNARYGGAIAKRNLWVLAFIGFFLIITACVNFINLATAQTLSRAKEVGVRKVLGSRRGQLFWQFIAQTGVITGLALVLAVLLAVVVLPYVNTWFKTHISVAMLIDPQLLLFVPLLVVFVTFVAGSYPGLILAGFQPVVALKGKLSQQNIGGFNTRRALIITQFALSQVLVIGLIVIAKQMNYARQSDLGFDKDAVVMIPIGSEYQKAKSIKGQFEQLAGVRDVSLCFAAPASNGDNWNTTPRYNNNPDEEAFRISVKAADADYLKTFGLTLVAGRNVFPADTAREFVVNEAFARKLNLASPQELLGKKLQVNAQFDGPIVGVVKDFHDLSFHEEINPIGIFSSPELYNTFAVKLNTGNLVATMETLKNTWSSNNPGKIYNYEFVDDDIASFYETESLMLNLIQVFSALALFIGCLGLYGLVSFMAVQKTKEIGIRKVLGSTIGQILWIFGKEFARLILVAFV